MKNNNKIICFGEVLWDVVDGQRLIGGAPLNVCYHLSKLGIDSKIVSRVGADEDGLELLAGIKLLGVNTEHISTSDTDPTSRVLVNASASGKVTYDIVENVAWDFIPFDEKARNEIDISSCIVYGTLAARNAASRETLLQYLRCPAWKVLDLNLRQPYYDKEIIGQLLSFSNTLKINDEELLIIGDLFFGEDRNPLSLIDCIFDGFQNIEEIILTRGADGVSYYSKHQIIEIPGLKVNVVDTVGSGDSFLAAFLAGKRQNKSVAESLRLAIALSAFVASRQGACPNYTFDEIKSLMTDIESS